MKSEIVGLLQDLEQVCLVSRLDFILSKYVMRKFSSRDDEIILSASGASCI